MATRFEWDENKDRTSRRKHGIDFETAARVFADPQAVMRYDRDIGDEQRWQTIGSLDGGFPVLLVVHTLTDRSADQLVRIVSARKATRKAHRPHVSVVRESLVRTETL